MKKFLMLSFLMVLFTVAVSFAQTRTVYHYGTPGVNKLGYQIYDSNPGDPFNKLYDAYTTVNVMPGDTIENTYINITVEYKDGNYRWLYNESTTDMAALFCTVDTRDIVQIWYSFEVRFKNGDSEIYDVFDVY